MPNPDAYTKRYGQSPLSNRESEVGSSQLMKNETALIEQMTIHGHVVMSERNLWLKDFFR
jgi:hypothetical protein